MFEDFNTKIHLRTDWADLDLFGHVNNVAYFRYVQSARVFYCDNIGLSSLNKTPLSFMVAKTQCEFRNALRYPEEITVYTKVNWLKNTSFELSHLIVNEQSVICALATDILVVYDHQQKHKAVISPELEAKITEIEKRKIR